VISKEGLARQRGGKATPEKFCIRWWQARRARSDAPYRAGLATGPFDCIAHFGVGDKPNVEDAQLAALGWPRDGAGQREGASTRRR